MVLRLLIPFLSLIPLGILAGVVRAWTAFQAAADTTRPPVESRPSLRLPGESARAKLEQLDVEITRCLALASAVFPLLLLAYLVTAGNIASASSFWTGGAVVGVVVLVWLAVRLILLLHHRRNWRLGLSGEKLVGEELNRLLKHDCQVFHDFPLIDDWNIDHIVIAHSGVYAIETKCRPKKDQGAKTQRSYEVIFDGHGLQFPHYYNTSMVSQAQCQADRLSQFLTNALDTNIPVTPILALPGWLIRHETPGGLAVLNPHQELGDFILSRPRSLLPPDTLSAVAGHLDRDVEFA